MKKMLSLKHVSTKSRTLTSPFQFVKQTIIFNSSSSSTSDTSSSHFNPIQPSPIFNKRDSNTNFQSNEVFHSFKEWFKTRNYALLDRIFEILTAHDEFACDYLGFSRSVSGDLALTQLGLRLDEGFVLEVLNYGKDVLSCLKFFDWAGRQPGFCHSRVTFHAIFKILSRAKMMSLMLDFLGSCTKRRLDHKVRFYDTLVMGYAIAGRLDLALQQFGNMRFQGLDLDTFAYHVLLNALVEDNCLDIVDDIVRQVRMRGFESEITHAIVVKSLCRQKKMDEAERYFRELFIHGGKVNGHVLSKVVDGFCKNGQLERAGKLMEEFWDCGTVHMEQAYNVWIRDLVQAGKLDNALDFVQRKKLKEGFVPDLFQYNVLIYRLLRENRLEELFDLLMEMKENQISPNKVTMNAALCFFCKAGMVNMALQLYNAGAELGLSPNSMAYNYLINTLCGDGSIDDAYRVLKNSIAQGYFPVGKTFSILVENLCRERKLEEINVVYSVALDNNFASNDSTCDMVISALCQDNRVEDGYTIHRQRNQLNKVSTKKTYYNLIHGFNKSNRGDIAAELLVEMQEKGHKPVRTLFRAVIHCLCQIDNPRPQFLKLLLSHPKPSCGIYNNFIDGAGHANKPDLAREVFEIMRRSGIVPNLSSDILVLQSYIMNRRFSDALIFFNEICKRRKIGRKLYNTMVVGLSKANRPDIAMGIFMENKVNKGVPSIECYEELIKALCSNEQYDAVVQLIDDLEKCGRNVSSFIGNVLLSHSLKTQELYKSWFRLKEVQDDKSSNMMLGQLIGAFSSLRMNDHIEELEKMIESCFPLDIFTYNLLLRRISISEIDLACEYFNRLCEKGYEPNRFTYDTLAHGLLKHGRISEGKRCIDEMSRKGFRPSEHTLSLL